jgi:hypothetical protein
MADPHSTTAALGSAFGLAAVSAVMGPVLGPWAVVVAGSLFGAALAATEAPGTAVRSAVVFIRAVCVALPCAGAASFWIAPHVGDDQGIMVMPAAVLLAWQHHRIPALVRMGIERFRNRGSP